MSVWVCVPSARPPSEVRAWMYEWNSRGYHVALWRDALSGVDGADLTIFGEYPGYAKASNALIKQVLETDRLCDWVVCGGDDVFPDPTHTAEGIAQECTEHFRGTLGVMQPTGDRWAGGSIDRIAGSPWIGREFCRRAYCGFGPFWPEFWHMFGDEHLQAVASVLGIFAQRRDLVHLHQHWIRQGQKMPAFLEQANSAEHWNEMKGLFERLKAGGFAEAWDLLPA